jgi:enduracididine biosynthesis enzyme MppQ
VAHGDGQKTDNGIARIERACYRLAVATMPNSLWPPGVVQFVPRPGIIDVGPGYLDPSLLPVDALREGLDAATAAYGPAILAYGANAGPRPLRAHLAERQARWDGSPYGPEHVVITGGTSQMLDHLTGTLAAPGDVVLAEGPSYNWGCGIFRDHDLRVVRLAEDDAGIDPDAMARRVDEERRAGRRVAFAYLIPTFHNPTGRVMSHERRLRLLEVAGAYRLPIVEDNAYRDIVLDEAPPPSLLSLSGYQGVIQLSSFSKCLAPGLRLGWLSADAGTVERLEASNLLISGGCLNHLVALAVLQLTESGWLDRHVIGLRRALAARRDALVAGLREHLPSDFRFHVPRGGFFVWLELPEGVEEATLRDAAERRGVSFAPGSAFEPPEGTRAARLSFSLHPPETLRTAAERLGTAVRDLAGKR